MINLVVVSLRGAPVGRAASAQFGPAGGTIGRAATNTLVLDDPDRTVSRVHAQVLCRDGQFFVVDRGSNPLLHNGHALGPGNEAALAPGDRLMIGSFELMAQAAAQEAAPAMRAPAAAPLASAAASTDDDPFADLLAGLGPAPAPAPAMRAAPAPSPDPLQFPDPMQSGAGKAGAASDDDPFADLLGSGSGGAKAGRGPLDDFSDLGAPGSGRAVRIDDMFGGTGGAGGIGGDPLALSPLADPLRQPNTASESDPFAALQGTPQPSARPRSDHVPIERMGYMPPKEASAPAAAPVAPPAARVAAPSPASRGPASDQANQALWAAFLRGVNSTHQMPEALTPELMERIGVLLRSATEGTLQLLLTRQELKREVRAEVTMIAAQANNPLKFSPTAEVALAHLLGPGVRGFMGPEAAMRDAYDDLRAHEFGVMVGMRAALAHVISRFTPEELEKKIAAKSALDSLFAANRKAKLWDQFVQLSAGIAAEAEDDFHSLFGKAFLQAYQEQMARLKSNR